MLKFILFSAIYLSVAAAVALGAEVLSIWRQHEH